MGSAARVEVGIACGKCDCFCPRIARVCPHCGVELDVQPAGQPTGFLARVTIGPGPELDSKSVAFGGSSLSGSRERDPGAAATPSRPEEKAMEQARYYVCESCMTPVPSGHKFCGRCGAPVPEEMLHQLVNFYSDMQDPGGA